MGNKSSSTTSSSSSSPSSDPFAASSDQQKAHYDRENRKALAKIKRADEERTKDLQGKYRENGHLPPIQTTNQTHQNLNKNHPINENKSNESDTDSDSDVNETNPNDDDDPDTPPPITSLIDRTVPSDEYVPLRLSTRTVNADGSITITTRTLLGESSITFPPPSPSTTDNNKNNKKSSSSSTSASNKNDLYKHSDTEVINFVILGNLPKVKHFIEVAGNGDPNYLGIYQNSFSIIHVICALNIYLLSPLFEYYGNRINFNVFTTRALVIQGKKDNFYRSLHDYLSMAKIKYSNNNRDNTQRVKLINTITSSLSFSSSSPPSLSSISRPINSSLDWSHTHCHDHCSLDSESLYRDSHFTPIHLLLIFQPYDMCIDGIEDIIMSRGGGDMRIKTSRLLNTPLHLAVRRSGEDMQILIEEKKDEERRRRKEAKRDDDNDYDYSGHVDISTLFVPSPLLEMLLPYCNIMDTNLAEFTAEEIASENTLNKQIYQNTMELIEGKIRLVWECLAMGRKGGLVGRDLGKIVIQYCGWEMISKERKVIEGRFSGEEEWGTEETYSEDEDEEENNNEQRNQWNEKKTEELNDEEIEAALERQLGLAANAQGKLQKKGGGKMAKRSSADFR